MFVRNKCFILKNKARQNEDTLMEKVTGRELYDGVRYCSGVNVLEVGHQSTSVGTTENSNRYDWHDRESLFFAFSTKQLLTLLAIFTL